MKKTTILIYLLIAVLSASAQLQRLTLQDALAKGLSNNFSILIAGNDAEISQNNNTLGNAGFLPTVGATGSFRSSYLSLENKDQLGNVTKTSNANSQTLSGGASLDWTLFDGFGMFLRRDKLSMLESMGETAYKTTVENVLSEIIMSYSAVVQSSNRLQVLQNAINFSNVRFELVKKKYQIGSASELAFLQATTDLNADSASYLRQEVALKNAKANLNTILVVAPETDFETESTISFGEIIDIMPIKDSLASVNSSVQLAKQRSLVANLDYRIAHSPQYPQLGFFTDYNYSNVKNDYGQTRANRSVGPVVGLNLIIPIFDGGNKRRQATNARIEAESSKYEYEQTLRQIESTLFQVYNDYLSNLKLVKLEEANLKVAVQNTKIAFEKYRVGEMSDIDLRQIQLSQLEAENSLLVAQYQAKISETELLRISGKLIKDNQN